MRALYFTAFDDTADIGDFDTEGEALMACHQAWENGSGGRLSVWAVLPSGDTEVALYRPRQRV